MSKLKANPIHPTFKKLQRIIGLLENIQLDLEWRDGCLKIRDHEFGVTYDFLHKDEDTPMNDLPPLFEFRLSRDQVINKYCKCRFCDSNFGK